jgi:hypothetical protein
MGEQDHALQGITSDQYRKLRDEYNTFPSAPFSSVRSKNLVSANAERELCKSYHFAPAVVEGG